MYFEPQFFNDINKYVFGQSVDVIVSSDVVADMLSLSFFMLVISIYFALESCFGMSKHYLWFSFLSMHELCHQELLEGHILSGRIQWFGCCFDSLIGLV